MKIKINPNTVSSGIISSLLKEKMEFNQKKDDVKPGVSLLDIAKKVVAKKFPTEGEKESE